MHSPKEWHYDDGEVSFSYPIRKEDTLAASTQQQRQEDEYPSETENDFDIQSDSDFSEGASSPVSQTNLQEEPVATSKRSSTTAQQSNTSTSPKAPIPPNPPPPPSSRLNIDFSISKLPSILCRLLVSALFEDTDTNANTTSTKKTGYTVSASRTNDKISLLDILVKLQQVKYSKLPNLGEVAEYFVTGTSTLQSKPLFDLTRELDVGTYQFAANFVRLLGDASAISLSSLIASQQQLSPSSSLLGEQPAYEDVLLVRSLVYSKIESLLSSRKFVNVVCTQCCLSLTCALLLGHIEAHIAQFEDPREKLSKPRRPLLSRMQAGLLFGCLPYTNCSTCHHSAHSVQTLLLRSAQKSCMVLWSLNDKLLGEQYAMRIWPFSSSESNGGARRQILKRTRVEDTPTGDTALRELQRLVLQFYPQLRTLPNALPYAQLFLVAIIESSIAALYRDYERGFFLTTSAGSTTAKPALAAGSFEKRIKRVCPCPILRALARRVSSSYHPTGVAPKISYCNCVHKNQVNIVFLKVDTPEPTDIERYDGVDAAIETMFYRQCTLPRDSQEASDFQEQLRIQRLIDREQLSQKARTKLERKRQASKKRTSTTTITSDTSLSSEKRGNQKVAQPHLTAVQAETAERVKRLDQRFKVRKRRTPLHENNSLQSVSATNKRGKVHENGSTHNDDKQRRQDRVPNRPKTSSSSRKRSISTAKSRTTKELTQKSNFRRRRILRMERAMQQQRQMEAENGSESVITHSTTETRKRRKKLLTTQSMRRQYVDTLEEACATTDTPTFVRRRHAEETTTSSSSTPPSTSYQPLRRKPPADTQARLTKALRLLKELQELGE